MLDVAQKEGLEIWPARGVKGPAFAERIRAAGVDVLLNVHSLHVMPEAVVEAPRVGSFNLHPGPLPRYAGLNAPSWAIYRGESTHGVTVHKMTAGIDDGPIVYRKTFAIGEQDTGLSVALRCVTEGVPLLLELLEVASRAPSEIPLTPQDPADREFFGREIPQDGIVDWTRPAKDVFNFIRASDYAPFPSPWGTPRAMLDGGQIGILKAALTNRSTSSAAGAVHITDQGQVLVACTDEWIEIRKVLLDGRVMSAAHVLPAGSRLSVGA